MTQAEKECINKLRTDGLGAVRIAYPIFNKYTQKTEQASDSICFETV